MFSPWQVTAAVANFYVPTLSMLYIYGRMLHNTAQYGNGVGVIIWVRSTLDRLLLVLEVNLIDQGSLRCEQCPILFDWKVHFNLVAIKFII